MVLANGCRLACVVALSLAAAILALAIGVVISHSARLAIYETQSFFGIQ
jgi:hypothetical protein